MDSDSIEISLSTADYQFLLNLIEKTKECHTFLHTTNMIEKCESICLNGFIFETFLKSADFVDDLCSLKYMMSIRKHYGYYTVMIQIDKNITTYESISRRSTDVDNDEVFILPPQYIRGYYNRITHEFVQNLNWNPPGFY